MTGGTAGAIPGGATPSNADIFATDTSVAMSAIVDGTSTTIAVIEDAGRIAPTSQIANTYYTLSGYNDIGTFTDVTGAAGGTALRGVWRWADPDACGSGISGPPNAAGLAGATGDYVGNVVNQNPILGGPGGINSTATVDTGTDSTKGTITGGTTTDCPWTIQNCGLNDEPFSFHRGGTNCVMVDGSARFLSERVSPFTMRQLVTRGDNDGTPTEVDW
jgi:prepilin-type processing-associated H-X9-DG protein